MQFCASEACIPLLFLRNAEGEPCGPPEFPDAVLPKHSGIYKIFDIHGKLIVLDKTSNLFERFTRYYGERSERVRDLDLREITGRIEYIRTDSAFETCFPRRGGNGASVGYREWSCGFISIARIKHLQSGRCRIHRWENYQIGRKANFVTGTGNSRGPTLDRRIPDRSSRVRQHLRPGRSAISTLSRSAR